MHAVAEAQPNIALVKYWGKRDIGENLPAVGSLSLTLDSLWTRMQVDFGGGGRRDELEVNGKPAAAMQVRVSRCLDRVAGVDRPRARVVSESNFPIGAGLASSASAFAALVVAAAHAAGKEPDQLALAKLAGQASGSAARSLYGGIVELKAGESDIDVYSLLDAAAWPLTVIVAVNSEIAKPVASGEAMIRGAATSPFYASWVARQEADLAAARRAVAARDFAGLAGVAEHNCLKMHSLMWTSRPPIVYWNPVTIACLEAIRELQAAGAPVFFTMDAGPQVKAVCPADAADEVRTTLAAVPGVKRTMESGLGAGARLVDQT